MIESLSGFSSTADDAAKAHANLAETLRRRARDCTDPSTTGTDTMTPDHTCCACFTHNRLPCCNAGHDDATRLWLAERDDARAALETLYKLHNPSRDSGRGVLTAPGREYCIDDGEFWPCESVRVIDAALGATTGTTE